MEPLKGEILNINNEYGSYQEYKAAVDAELQRSAESFVRIGYLLKVARDTDILKESGYGSVNEFAYAEYGLDKSQVSRFIRINDEYSEEGYSDVLQEKYRAFGYAKLAMMLTLPASVSEELTASYTKAEIGMLKEEIDAEQGVSDLEVMMEEPNRQQEGYEPIGKVLHQLGHDNPEMYVKLMDVFLTRAGVGSHAIENFAEVLAPSGEHIHSVRIAGEGRKLLSIKGPETDPVIIDVRSGNKHIVSWDALIYAIGFICTFDEVEEEYRSDSRCLWEKLYGEPFPVKEEPKNTSVAPVQPKKESKVTKAKVQNHTNTHKDQVENRNNNREENHETEEQQDTQISPNPDNEAPAAVDGSADSESSGIGQPEAEPSDNASGTGDGKLAAEDGADTANKPQAAGHIKELCDILSTAYWMAEHNQYQAAMCKLDKARKILDKAREMLYELFIHETAKGGEE